MSEMFACKRYEDLVEGEPVVFFGKYCLRWDFDFYGKPDYGFVPVDTSTCLWQEYFVCNWHTACGVVFEFPHDGPKENHAIYCLYCGKKILVEKYQPEEEE